MKGCGKNIMDADMIPTDDVFCGKECPYCDDNTRHYCKECSPTTVKEKKA